MTTSTANPNKALWEKGDFTRIAATMRESGDDLVQRIGVSKGLKVLDLGCGDGTTALPEAKRGADVLGVDIARNLVEAGKKRPWNMASATSSLRRATRRTSMDCRIECLIWSLVFSGQCLPLNRSMSPKKWCG